MKAIGKLEELIWWGIGWNNYDNNLTVQENCIKLKEKPDLIISYKPLEMKDFKSVNIPKCLRYNEMFDFEWTKKEIIESSADFVICHHKNEMTYYQKYFGDNFKFYHVPHSAEKTIFKDYNLPKTIDLLLAGKIDKSYVLRERLSKLIIKKRIYSKYKCVIYQHPGYINEDAFTDKYAIDYAKTINSSKITLTCSMIYRNRLAKYVEIPMCASALAADLPNQDQEEFKGFIIGLDNKMKNKELIDRVLFYLENDEERQKLIERGLKWSKNYTQEKYAERFISIAKNFLNKYYRKN